MMKSIVSICLLLILALVATGQAQSDPITSLEREAFRLNQQGKYREAIPVAESAVAACVARLGPNDPRTGRNIAVLAELYDDAGNPRKARDLGEQALKILQRAYAPDNEVVYDAEQNLAVIYVHGGDYASAERLFQKVLETAQRLRGPMDPATAECLGNLGRFYTDTGQFSKAEPLLKRQVQIFEKVRGPLHADTAAAVFSLAAMYQSHGDFSQAEPLYLRALKIQEKVLPPNHPQRANSLYQLSLLYLQMGDYAKAESYGQQNLELTARSLGTGHPYYAESLQRLGDVSEHLGRYEEAEARYRQAVAITEKALGPENRETGAALLALANVLVDLHRNDEAEPLYRRSVAIFQKGGGDPSHLAHALNSLGLLCENRHEYGEAQTDLQQSLDIFRKTLGPNATETALGMHNLGTLLRRTGDYTQARSLFQQALEIRTRNLGPGHPLTASTLMSLAYVEMDAGDPAAALPWARRYVEASEKTLANVLSFTSEEQRLSYEGLDAPYSLLATLGSAPDLAQTILRHKGIVLDSLLEDRLLAQAAGDPSTHALADRLEAARRRLMQSVLKGKADAALHEQVEKLESDLARRVTGLGRARRALGVTVPQVQAALPKGAVLVEFLRYKHYLGKVAWDTRYGAVILSPSQEPRWVPLGPAPAIDEAVAVYLRIVKSAGSDAGASTILRMLYDRVWDPVEKACPAGVQQVVVSPDGQLNFVSLATLLGPDDRLLAEKVLISYVSSGRDLFYRAAPQQSRSMVLLGNPQFDLAVHVAAVPGPSARSVDTRDLENLAFPPLPGTLKECQAVASQGREWGWNVQLLTGSDANKTRLRQVRHPSILHLATHGFFLPREAPGKQTNPMYRSGIALAGAQSTLRAWKQGHPPSLDTGGLLLAEEVGGLQLKDTWLVTLSACETGVGEVRDGEGVIGLRRSFVQAGAQNLLMTLWPVADAETAEFMKAFYKTAHQMGNAPQALARVQRDLLVGWRKEKGLANAVSLAGPFIISFQGGLR